MWKHVGKLHRHERTCDAQVKLKFPGGAYNLPPTIFDQLADEGIYVPKNMRYYPYFAVFDFECYLDEADVRLKNTEKLHWKNKHKPLSVRISSNVPGFDRPHCIVSSGNEGDLVSEMVEYLVNISESSYRILEEEFKDVFEEIDSRVEEYMEAQFSGGELEEDEMVNDAIDLMSSSTEIEDEEMVESETEEDRAFVDDEVDYEQNPSFYHRIDNDQINNHACQQPLAVPDTREGDEQITHPLLNLKGKLWRHLKTLPVIGFNSGKYDINAVKEFIFPHLVKYEHIDFAIKRNQNHMSVKTEHLNFLDITNDLAPGSSYAQFLKAYECEETKGFFPYEWIDGLEKLEDTSLPQHEAFYSSLKNENITEEEYRYCQQVWEDNEMSTVKDFLAWYNNLDVGPFVEAVEKMKIFWRNRNIDMLKEGISVPGLTMKYLFSQLYHNTYFSLFNEKKKTYITCLETTTAEVQV